MAEQEVITAEKPKMTTEELIVHDTSEYAMLFDSAKFNQAWRVANAFAKSGLVPEHFKDNPAGVFVVLHMATRLELDPFMVLQKTYMVHGRPGMEAQLIIALVNARGPFTGPIQWETGGTGNDRYWLAYATHAKTGERCEAKVDWSMVKAEGWLDKKGTKWLTIPDLMGRYRSATFLARLYCPEVIMGLSTADELEDSLIELDSGIKVSPKPRTAIPSPREVDPVAVEEFDRLVIDEKNAEPNEGPVFKFVSQIAQVNKQTIEAVKAQASTPENFPTFWASFLKWQNPEKKSPGRPKKQTQPSSPAEKKVSPQGGTEGQEGDSAPNGDELMAILDKKGWPQAKLEVKFGKKLADWGESELKTLADMAAE